MFSPKLGSAVRHFQVVAVSSEVMDKNTSVGHVAEGRDKALVAAPSGLCAGPSSTDRAQEAQAVSSAEAELHALKRSAVAALGIRSFAVDFWVDGVSSATPMRTPRSG